MDIFCKDFKPFACVTLEQIRFWVCIMKEHAKFIKAGLGCCETEFIQEAERFYSVFETLEKQACAADCNDFTDILADIAGAVKKFFAFKRHLLHLALECKLDTHNPPLFYDHVSREAMYFIRLLERVDECLKYPVEAMTGDTAFWSKIMAEHLMFILGMLDPSERQLAEKAVAFNKKFEELYLQAMDFDHMLWHFEPVGGFSRFVEEVEVSTEQLRDFKEMIVNLLKQCCAISPMSSELAEHMEEEAEYFLQTLEKMEEQLEPCDAHSC